MTKTDDDKMGHPSSRSGRVSEELPNSQGTPERQFSGDEVTADLPAIHAAEAGRAAQAARNSLEMKTPVVGLGKVRVSKSDSATPIIFSPVAAARVPTPEAESAVVAVPSVVTIPRWAVAGMLGLTVALLVVVAVLLRS